MRPSRCASMIMGRKGGDSMDQEPNFRDRFRATRFGANAVTVQVVTAATLKQIDDEFIKQVIETVNQRSLARHPEVFYALLEQEAAGIVVVKYMSPHVHHDSSLLISRELWQIRGLTAGHGLISSSPADGWEATKLRATIQPVAGLEAVEFNSERIILSPGEIPAVAKIRRAA